MLKNSNLNLFNFFTQLSGLNSYAGYRIEITYFYYKPKKTKLTTGKKTIEIKEGLNTASSGKVKINLWVWGSFPENPSFRIVIISPKKNEIFNTKLSIAKGEELEIELEDYMNKDQSFKVVIEKAQTKSRTADFYKDFKLFVSTVIKRGVSTITYSHESLLLPNFEANIEASEADSIESVSLQIVTPKGEVIYAQSDKKGNIQTWQNLLIEKGNPLWNEAKRTLKIALPIPNQIVSDVHLSEGLEKRLDVWEGHKLIMSYDILNKETFAFTARIEEEYEIQTDINDKKGKAQLDLSYYGIVEVVNFEVQSPLGEVIGRSQKSPREIAEGNHIIEVEVPPRRIEKIFGQKIFPDRPKRSIGRVIDFYGQRKFENTQVIIYAAAKPDNPGDELVYHPIVTSTTETGGYFVIDTPEGFYEDAYAIIGVEGQDTDKVKISIRLEQDEIIEKVLEDEDSQEIREQFVREYFFPAHFILVVDPIVETEAKADKECGDCKELGFHEPRKVLEEFSYYSVVRTTEPQIRGYTLAEEGFMEVGDFIDLIEDYETESDKLPVQVERLKIEKRILLKYINNRRGLSVRNLIKAISESKAFRLKEKIKARKDVRAIGRNILTADEPIDWDEDPTIYQATSLAHRHILHFKQEWVNDGYSMGDLLYSLPLAPGQKKQIVVFDWERKEAAKGVEEVDYQEGLYNSLGRDRDINEIVNGSISENALGFSTAKTSSHSLAGSAAYGAGAVGPGFIMGGGAVISGSMGKSSSASLAYQRASRKSTLTSLQRLRDQTSQAASATRSLRSTVVQTVTQGERFSVETETVANYNHCHALTIQYFEVLRHFQIQNRLADVQACLFVPLEMSKFDVKKTLRWREILSRYLLKDPYSRNLETRHFIKGVRNPLRRGFAAIERRESLYENSDLPTGIYADEGIDYIEGSLSFRFQLTRPRDTTDENGDAIIDDSQWTWLYYLLPSLTPAGLRAFYIHETIENMRDLFFHTYAAPEIADAFVQHLKVEAVLETGNTIDLEMDATLVSKYKDNQNLQVSLRMGGTNATGLKRADIKFIRISTDVIGDNGDYLSASDLLPENSRVIIQSGFMSYKTEHVSSYLFRNSRIHNDLTGRDEVQIYTPLNRVEERNPRQEDEELAEALIDHLNDNLEYYHGIIWMHMDPRRRFMFLDGIQVVDYSEVDTYPAGVVRSVASVVENRVIGIEGNSLIMPVAPGFSLDPNLKGQEIDLFEWYKPSSPIDPMKVSIPTKGVFAEAVMGKCNSCEKKEEDRFWRWSEEPIPDSPTAIQPINTDSRRAEPLDTRPTEFPNPVVNIQNAPAAPNPTGLAALSQLLANPNFENITGLDANQRNALQGLLASFGTTSAFGSMASQLASNGMNLAAQLESIKKAKENNIIDQPTAGELYQEAFNSNIDSVGYSENEVFSQIRQINDAVSKGQISPELGESMIRQSLDNNANKNKTLLDNPTIQNRIARGDEIEYSSGEDRIVLSSIGPTPAEEESEMVKFLVHFRRPNVFNRVNKNGKTFATSYAGHFGFDWLRDEYIYPIKEVQYKQENGDDVTWKKYKAPICTNPYELKKKYLEGVRTINPYHGQEYFPAWLSIFPPRGVQGGASIHEEGVMLSLEIEKIEEFDPSVLIDNDVLIEFESDDPQKILSISPSSIKLSELLVDTTNQALPEKGKILDKEQRIYRKYYEKTDAITIKSKEGVLYEHAEVKVFARPLDSEERKQVGQLMVYQNHAIPTLELVVVWVTHDPSDIDKGATIYDFLENQSFNQALIKAEVVSTEKFVINNLKPTNQEVQQKLEQFKQKFPPEKKLVGNENETVYEQKEFKDELWDLYQNLGVNYDPDPKKTYVFITNQKSSKIEGLADSPTKGENWVSSNYCVVFNYNKNVNKHLSNRTIVHEIGHSLFLNHTFDLDTVIYKTPNFRIFRGHTDNFMDYSQQIDGTTNNHNDRLYFYKWQWDKMREDQSVKYDE